MSGFQLGAFRPVETPDLGATLSRMAAIDAQQQQTALARQAFEQDQGFNRTLAAAAPGLASGQGPAYDSAVASIAAAGPRGLTVALPLLQRSQDRREAADFWRQGSGTTPAVAPAGGATLPPGDPSLPRGLRNNNPLNLTYVAGQPGVQGSDGRFGRYATPEEGIAASVRQLQMYGQRGLTTPTQIIGQWAPPSENNTGAYVAAVSRAAGLDPNQPVDLSDPAVVSRLVGAMAQHENGRPLDPAVVQRGVQMGLGGGAAPASAPASTPQAPGGINPAELALLERAMQHPNPQVQQQARARLEILRLRQQNNPEQYVTATENIGGRQVQGQRNTRTGQFTPFPGQTGAEQTGPFSGNSMDAQANNVALSLADKVRAGTATPAEQALYQRAYSHLAGGTIQYVVDPSDPTGLRQVAVRVPRDMGDLPAPGGGAAPGQAAPQQGVTTPTQGMTTPTQAGATADASPMPTAPNAIPGMERMTPPPAGFRRREDGTMEPIPGGPQDPNQASAGDRTRLRQIETDAQGILDALKSFRTARNDSTMLERGIAATGIPTTLSTAWTNAALLAKGEALYNLGVLSGPDLSIIQRALSDPATLRGFFTGDVTANGQIDAIETLIRQRVANARRQYGGPQAQSPGPGGVGTAEPPPAASRSAPAPGTVQDGYRFRGGDPSQQSNWERVQ